MTLPTSILVGTDGPDGRTVWIRVEGKGTFQNSTGLKEFGKEMTNRGYRQFVVDLKKCPVMDSTFMGTLAFLALRLRELGSGELSVINLNPRNSDLLGNLGLDQLFTVCPALEGSDAPPAATTEALPAATDDKLTRTETMLAAHYAVIEANPANAPKFKDVLDYLKQDLNRLR